MRKIFLLILPVLMGICSCSPSEEDITFKGVELIVTGAGSVNVEDNGQKLSVTVGQAGGTLLFEATGKHAGQGLISSVKSAGMDDYHYLTNIDNVFPSVFLENDELKVSILSDNPPITQLEVKENMQSGAKTHEAVFGGGYTRTTVIISQAGK